MVAEPVISVDSPHLKRQNQQTGGQTRAEVGRKGRVKKMALEVKGQGSGHCGALPCLLNQARLGERLRRVCESFLWIDF